MLRSTSLVVASTMLAVATCERPQAPARAPTPAPAPTPTPDLPIYSMACVSEEVHNVAGRLGFKRLRHITKSYWAEGRKTPRPWLDRERFERVLNLGLQPRPECFGEVRSVEPEYDGVILLDIESPFWSPLHRSKDYTDEDRDWAAGVFNAVTTELKRLRPQATVFLHNSVWPKAEPWSSDINSRVHGSSPSVYMWRKADRIKTAKEAMEWSWSIHAERLRAFLRYKANHPEFLIYPVVWAMWRDQREMQIPLAVAREHIRRVLALEHEGQRVDGLFVFSLTAQSDPEHDIAYLEMLADEAHKSAALR